MSPFQTKIIRILQAFFVTLLITIILLSLLRPTVLSPTQYVELQSCQQINPWVNRCITTRVMIDDFIESQNDQSESPGSE